MRIKSKLFQQAKLAVAASKSSLPLPPLATVQELVQLYNVKATKHLSQNFLYHPSVVNRFAAAAGKTLEGCHVCEVGPGPGSITRAILARKPDSLTAVEKDARFMPILKYVGDVVDGRLRLVHGDILKFDMLQAFPKELAHKWDESPPPFFVMGNLPFNISLPLMFQLFSHVSQKTGIYSLGRIPLIVTLQKEVAERMCAEPMEKQRSRLSLTTQYICDVKELFMIHRESFVPSPKVDVSVVKIVPKKVFDIDMSYSEVDHVVKHVMHFRQKHCQYGAASLFPPSREDLVSRLFKVSGVHPKMKPWHLTMNHYRDLCYAFAEIAKEIPQLWLVNTYQAKQWLKYFDESGEPLNSHEDLNSSCVNQSNNNAGVL